MNVSYVVFLEAHLQYLIARLAALEGEEQREMFDQVKKVRDLLNTEEELKRIRQVQLQIQELPFELA